MTSEAREPEGSREDEEPRNDSARKPLLNGHQDLGASGIRQTEHGGMVGATCSTVGAEHAMDVQDLRVKVCNSMRFSEPEQGDDIGESYQMVG